MPKVLVSNNSELLRHFTAPPFHRLDLQLLVAHSADEARTLFAEQEPPLVVVDAESEGYAIARQCKAHNPGTRVILVAVTANSLSKSGLALIAGGRRFGLAYLAVSLAAILAGGLIALAGSWAG